jgi:cytoskeleton protein RodZ
MDLNKPTGKKRLHLREVSDEDDGLLSYEGVGRDLRAARLNVGMERREVAVKLHIKGSYVHAIEDGNFDELPASVYAYGFVRSYAELLELDEDLIVRRFKNEWEGLGTSTQLAFPEPPEEIRLPRGPLIIGSCLLAAVIYGGWYTVSHQDRIDLPRVSEVPQQFVTQATPPVAGDEPAKIVASPANPTTNQSILAAKPPIAPVAIAEKKPAKVVTSSSVQKAEDKPALVKPMAQAPAAKKAPAVTVAATLIPLKPATKVPAAQTHQPAKYGDTNKGRVTLRARADTWVRVQADENNGQVYLGRILHAGDEFRLPDRADLFLMTGNAGGIEILVDGKKVKSIGSLGMVRRRVLLDPKLLIAGKAVDEN